MHICFANLAIIGSYNGLSPGRRQTVIWTSYEISLIGPLVTNFTEILNWTSNIFIAENTFEKIVCKMVSILSLPQWVKWIQALQNKVQQHNVHIFVEYTIIPVIFTEL